MYARVRDYQENFKGKYDNHQYFHYHVRNKTVDEVCSIIRRWHMQHVGRGNPCVIAYDYVKLTGEKVDRNWAEHQAIGEKIDKLGLKSSDTAPIYFDDVRVPQEYRIGLEGEGFTMQMQQFQEERIFLSASCLVMLDESIKQTIDYCKDRKAFGGKIIDNQFIQFKLAELQTEIESLRSLVYRACEEFIESGDMTYLASMAKLKSGRLLRETADTCLQYWGGMGFTWENPLAKLYRDGRLMSIGGGTDEIMLKIICKHIGIGK